MIVPDQTIGAFYKRLHGHGHTAADLRRVQEAYVLATELFAATYRGSGRPFVCHLVGTASVIAQLDRQIELILCGLLHAAFDQGVFPDGRRGKSNGHRELVATRVGQTCAALVDNYKSFRWNHDVINQLAASCPSDEPARQLVFLRLCNEVDDMVDAGLTMASNGHDGVRERAKHCATLARAIGKEELATTIEVLAEESLNAHWAFALDHISKKSYRLIPGVAAYFRIRSERGKRNVRILGATTRLIAR